MVTPLVVASVALLQLVIAVAIATSSGGGGFAGPPPLVAGAIAAYTAGAGFLLAAGRTDGRATVLGAIFAAVATTFAVPLARAAVGDVPGPLMAMAIVDAVRPDALLPYLLWRFVADFPRVSGPDPYVRANRIITRALLWMGVALFAINLMAFATSGPSLLGPLTRFAPASLYWLLVLGSALPALVLMPIRNRYADRTEQRRVRLLLFSLAVGSAPILVFSLMDAVGLMENEAFFKVTWWIAFPPLIMMPIATAYAVLVHRALDVRLIVRKAIQYALARYTLIAATAIPIGVIMLFVFRNRGTPVGELFTGREATVLVALSVVSAVALRWRVRLLEALDHRFFRERYDAQRVLRGLVDDARRADSVASISRLLVRQLDRALHPTVVLTLIANRTDGWLMGVDGSLRPLGPDGPLVSSLSRSGAVSDVSRGQLPASEEELRWLDRNSVHLVAPLLGRVNTLLGLVAFGEKRSELPYTAEDRELIRLATSAASTALENTVLRERTLRFGASTSPHDDAPPARECSCGAVHPADRDECRHCGAVLTTARLPAVVGGKFRVVRRLGSGGDGTVYLARDDGLGRDVALKGLHTPSVQSSMRLRKEARTLAATSHPNLAGIYGTEDWRNGTFLVLEFLPGGTLRDRLTEGPLGGAEAMRVGVELAGVLAYLHGRNLMHRDIKPSNVGFAQDGSVKLMDFGLATIGNALDPEAEGGEEPHDALITRSGPLPGTIPYLSPEAIAGSPAMPRDDLWSLSILVCESVTGINPFRGRTAASTIARILEGRPRWPPVDAFQRIPGMHDLLRRSLSPDPRARPSSAEELQAAYQVMAGGRDHVMGRERGEPLGRSREKRP